MSYDKNNPPYVAHFDGNQVPSLVGVVGTLGTTDTGGTARVIPIGVNEATGAMYVQDLSGASGTTNVLVVGGTLNAGTVVGNIAVGGSTSGNPVRIGAQYSVSDGVGTLRALNTDFEGHLRVTIADENSHTAYAPILTNDSNNNNGINGLSVVVAGGQVTSGALAGSNPVLIGGTDSSGTVRVPLIDTTGAAKIAGLPSGTVTTGSLTNIANLLNGTVVVPTGTITTGSLTNLANLYNGSVNILTGTIQSSGTTTGVGVVSNLTNGSVNILTGTIQSSGTTTGVGVVSNLTNGSVNILTGTIQSSGNGTTVGGTLGNLNYGTIAIDAKPAGSTILTSHTLGTGGGTFVGTLVAPVGAGTYIYLTGFSIVARSGGTIDVALANNVAGTTGAGVIFRGAIPTAGGGIARDLNPALRLGTNGTLAYALITAGTADISYTYWVGP